MVVEKTPMEIVERKFELSKTLTQKLRTVTHIVNVLSRRCIVKHDIKLHDIGDDIAIDVFLAPFLDRVRQYDAISQVSAQLRFPMFANRDTNFDLLNFFDWSVIKKDERDEDKCFIRFIVYQKPFSELFVCKTCGEITSRTYGSHSRNCPTCGFLKYGEYEHKRRDEFIDEKKKTLKK